VLLHGCRSTSVYRTHLRVEGFTEWGVAGSAGHSIAPSLVHCGLHQSPCLRQVSDRGSSHRDCTRGCPLHTGGSEEACRGLFWRRRHALPGGTPTSSALHNPTSRVHKSTGSLPQPSDLDHAPDEASGCIEYPYLPIVLKDTAGFRGTESFGSKKRGAEGVQCRAQGSLILEGASMCLLSKCIPAALKGGKSFLNAGTSRHCLCFPSMVLR